MEDLTWAYGSGTIQVHHGGLDESKQQAWWLEQNPWLMVCSNHEAEEQAYSRERLFTLKGFYHDSQSCIASSKATPPTRDQGFKDKNPWGDSLIQPWQPNLSICVLILSSIEWL